MNAPALTRAEEGREYVEDGCRVVYGRTWDGPFEKMPTEGMKDVWRDLVRKAQQPIATHLSATEARAAQAEAEVARLRERVATLEAALRPFANYAADMPGADFGEGEIGEYYHDGFRRSICTQDLRAARTALEASHEDN